jgi:hypothetical protein
MMRRKISRLLPALMFAVAATLPLESHAAEVRPIVKAGYDLGGDTVVNVAGKSVRANKGFFAGGGVSILADSKVLEGEISASYKFFTVTAPDGDIDWTVLPLDALVFYNLPEFRFGGGLTYRLNPTLKGRRAAGGLNASYGDALGLVLQADYVFDKRFTFGLRYTRVDYKQDSVQTNPSVAATPPANLRASGFGIVIGIVSF